MHIKVYVLNHADGLAFLYVNNSNRYTLTEEVEFTLKGCHIEGTYGSYIEITVEPRSERLLKIVKNRNERVFDAKIKKCVYHIK